MTLTDFAAFAGRQCYPVLGILAWLVLALLGASVAGYVRPRSLTQDVTRAWQHLLVLCGGLAPMVGFLGTISGVRDGLGSLTGGGSADLSELGGDLSYAFGTTLVGLVIAGMALVANAILSLHAEAR